MRRDYTERVEQLVLALQTVSGTPSLRVLGRNMRWSKDTVCKYAEVAEARGVIERQRGARKQWTYRILDEAS